MTVASVALPEVDAERALLGALLHVEHAQAVELLDGLDASRFAETRHRAVVEAARAVVDDGDRPDPITVGAKLLDRRTDGIRFVGGDPRMLLADLHREVPNPVAWPTYRRLVLESSGLRDREEQHAKMRQALDGGDVEMFDELALRAATLEADTASRSALLPGLDLSRLDSPPGPLHWLVDGRMTACTYTVLGAKPGVGKSWLAYDLAVALCTGRPWLGHPVPRPLRVLYLDAENGPDLASRRLRQLGARSTDLDGRLLVSTDPLILTRPADLQRLRATIAAHRPDLVVIDTLASHAPAAESDTESMAGFLADVWTLVRTAGAALLLLHHLRKGQQGSGKDDPLDSFRGAGHLVGAADRAWVLDPLAPGEPRFILRDVKPRQFPCAPPTRITVVDDDSSASDDRRTRIEVAGIEPAVERGYDAFLAAALTFIDAHGGRPVPTKDLVHVGMTGADEPSERSCKDWLSRAEAAGVLHKPKRGLWLRAQATLPEPDDTPDED